MAQADLMGGLLEEDAAGRAFPARVGVGEKFADVALADGPEHGVADGVHEGVGVGVAIESLVVGNGDAAEDEGAAGDQLVDIVSNSYMNHAADCRGGWGKLKG